MDKRTRRRLSLGISALLLGGCAGYYPVEQPLRSEPARPPLTDRGVAVLGVTARAGQSLGISASWLAGEASRMLGDELGVNVFRTDVVREALGKPGYDDLLTTLAHTGRFDGPSIERLQAAGLPAPAVLVLILENDKVEELPASRREVHGARGNLLRDREEITWATRRSTALTGLLLDVTSGREQAYTFKAEPVNRVSRVQYLGSSFLGSVAASVANSMTQGNGSGQQAAAPSLRDSLTSLVRSVVLELKLPHY